MCQLLFPLIGNPAETQTQDSYTEAFVPRNPLGTLPEGCPKPPHIAYPGRSTQLSAFGAKKSVDSGVIAGAPLLWRNLSIGVLGRMALAVD